MDVREKLVEMLTNSPQLDVLDWTTGWEEAANYLIANGVTVQEWISVKDRLPKVGEDVLVIGYWHEKFQPLMCYLSPHRKGGWFTSIAGHQVYTVTHWMPLPQPPKGD